MKIKCTCGYEPRDEQDLDEHIIEMAKVTDTQEHHEGR